MTLLRACTCHVVVCSFVHPPIHSIFHLFVRSFTISINQSINQSTIMPFNICVFFVSFPVFAVSAPITRRVDTSPISHVLCCVGLDAALGAGPHWQDVPVPHGGGSLPLRPAGSLCAVCCSLNCLDSADGVALLSHMARPGNLAVLQQHANRCNDFVIMGLGLKAHTLEL